MAKYNITLDKENKTSETYRALKSGTFGKKDSPWNEEQIGRLFERFLIECSDVRNVLRKRSII